MEGTETYYSPKDVKMSLDIGDSTLRKWCLAIEKHGFLFSRTDNNRRIFTEKDIVMLKHFQNLVQVQHMSAENASIIIASRFNEQASPEENIENSVPQVRSDNEDLQKLYDFMREQQEHIKRQEEFNKHLLERLDQQQEYINERLDTRDQKLMSTLDELQSQKKIEQEQREKELKQREKEIETKNKSIWERLLGK